MQQPLLTIAIPTFNRAKLLDRCLHYIVTQLDDNLKGSVELIVSDNASEDDTTAVVDKYINNGTAIRYYRNAENIRSDRNITACFLKATGKYVWVFSDDDLIQPGYLPLIVDLLKSGNFGNIYVKSIPFNNEYQHKGTIPTALNYNTFTNPITFVEEVNYFCTFITGNIVNKSLFKDLDYITEFYDSLLVQVSWILPSAFKGVPNVIVYDQVAACLSDNTGGYNLFRVFGKNFNKIMDDLIGKGLIDKQVKKLINKHLLISFFPTFMYSRDTKLEKDNSLKITMSVFWSYGTYWRRIFPTLFKRAIRR